MAPSTAIETTPIHGLTLLRREPVEDNRGSLDRVFDIDLATSLVPGFSVAQVNHTVTVGRGTVRGLHYQIPPLADAKILTCLRGRIFDVVVDLRPTSLTYRKWIHLELSAQNSKLVFIPRGCAHGFQTLEKNTSMFYQISSRYHPKSSRGIRFDDPILKIRWPLKISKISEKDLSYDYLET